MNGRPRTAYSNRATFQLYLTAAKSWTLRDLSSSRGGHASILAENTATASSPDNRCRVGCCRGGEHKAARGADTNGRSSESVSLEKLAEK